MRRFILLILLLPSLLFGAGELTTSRTEKPVQPLHMVFRVSKSTTNSVTYQDSAHFARKEYNKGPFQTVISPGDPLCYDSAGAKKLIDLTERPAVTKGYEKLTRVANSVYEYGADGRMRYEKNGKEWFETIPLFKGVKTRLEFTATGVKEFITLTDTLKRLAWELNDPYGIARRKIDPFTAVDVNGKPIKVTETWLANLLIVTVDKGLEDVILDPSIADTTIIAASGRLNATGTPWVDTRNATDANGVTAYGEGQPVGSGGTGNNRMALTFRITGIAGATVDSAKLFLQTDGTVPAGDSTQTYVAFGTYTGAALATTWYSKFIGRAASGAYTFTAATTAPFLWVAADGADWKSQLLTAATCDSIEAKQISGDSLRFILMSGGDMRSSNFANDYYFTAAGKPHLIIYYTASNPPGVTTVTDSLRFVIRQLYATTDSLGGANLTSRGFQYYLLGDPTDTTTVTQSGDYGTGTFNLPSDSMRIDTSYVFRAKVTGPGGTSYGAWDTLSTAVTSGSGASLKVAGRTVNTWIRR